MVTEFVSSDGVAISLADGEAGDIRGLVRLSLEIACATNTSRQYLVEIFQRLRSAGLRPWGDMEAELFESGSGCLLLARPRPPRQQRGTYRRRVKH